MPVYSPHCIDYAAGFDIVDTFTGFRYLPEEAAHQPAEIRSRLVHRPRKLGAMVMTIEESENCLKQRRIERGWII